MKGEQKRPDQADLEALGDVALLREPVARPRLPADDPEVVPDFLQDLLVERHGLHLAHSKLHVGSLEVLDLERRASKSPRA